MLKNILNNNRFASIKYNTLRYFSHYKTNMEVNEARKLLSSYWPKKDACCIRKNTINKPYKYDLQIVIPIYNVEKYIVACMDSILRQNTDFRYVIYAVDDCSTDNTRTILKGYEKYPNVRIIHNESNCGISATRNKGLKNIEAKYVMFVDSDDCLEDDAIQKLLERAYEKDADIVCGAHRRIFEDKEVFYSHYDCDQKVEDFSKIPGMPWGKVYRSELFQNVVFPEGCWHEDTIIRFLILSSAKSIYYINESVYKYRILGSSASHSKDKALRNIETYWVFEIIMNDYKLLKLNFDNHLLKSFSSQVAINGRRVRFLDTKIQEAVFVLTRSIIMDLFDSVEIKKYDNEILKLIVNNDFGLYKLYCQTH